MQATDTLLYCGAFVDGECRVTVTRGGKTRPLNPRFDLRQHSPTDFAWGYGGSGPAQLALALLADYFSAEKGGDQRAREHYQDSKFAVIGGLPQDGGWTLTGSQVAEALTRIQTV